MRKYVDLKNPPSTKRQSKHAVHAYEEEIIALEQQGNTVKSIYHIIQASGYTGTFSGVRTSVESIRRHRKHGFAQAPISTLTRRKLASIMWKIKSTISQEESEILNRCLVLYPELKPFYNSVQLFRSSIEDRDYLGFLQWLKPQLSDRASPFYHYARRLRSDLKAIRNAFTHSYSNGLLEGQINRLKTIKRITYGRASLKLLEKRVIYRL